MMEGAIAANGIVNMIHPLDLSIKVQCLCSRTSEEYVPAPQKSQSLQDCFVGLKSCHESVRWKWYWIERELKKKERMAQGLPTSDKLLGDVESLFLSDVWERNAGLVCLRKPSTATLTPIESKEVEAFLDNVIRMLLRDANKDEPQLETKKVRRIRELEEKQLEESYLIDSCYRIFGACRHRTRFHRLFQEKQSVKSTSTDEGIKPKRVDKDGWKRMR